MVSISSVPYFHFGVSNALLLFAESSTLMTTFLTTDCSQHADSKSVRRSFVASLERLPIALTESVVMHINQAITYTIRVGWPAVCVVFSFAHSVFITVRVCVCVSVCIVCVCMYVGVSRSQTPFASSSFAPELF